MESLFVYDRANYIGRQISTVFSSDILMWLNGHVRFCFDKNARYDLYAVQF